MLQDFAIGKCTRKCAIRGEALMPGEVFYSVILPAGEEFTRIDISAAAWQGPQANAVGWWKCRMPAAGAKRMRPAPTGVLLDLLSELLERPGQQPLAYFLALLLVRRRILTEADPMDDRQAGKTEPEIQHTWILNCPADGRQWLVPVYAPSRVDLPKLEEELSSLLFTEE